MADVEEEDMVLFFLDKLGRALENRGVTRQAIREMLPQSREQQDLSPKAARDDLYTVMIDEGAAATCINADTAHEVGLTVRQDPR